MSPYILFALTVAFSISSTVAEQPPLEIHVSTHGDDSWTGSRPGHTGTGREGPLATPAAALRALARHRASGDTRPAVITLHGGTYVLSSPLEIGPETTDDRPLIIRSAPGDTAMLTGSVATGPFRQVRDAETLRRLSPGARVAVRATNLRDAGVMEYGSVAQRGSPGLEVFFRGERMAMARYPDTGWLHVVDVPQDEGPPINPGLERERRFKDVPAGRHYGRFVYPGGRPSLWAPDDSILVHGYWTFDWSDSYQRVARFDTSRREVVLLPPHHHYGYTTGQRFAFLNVLEELDAPGEWTIDRRTGRLFFWPPDTLRPGDVRVTVLRDPMVRLQGTRQVTLERLHMAFSRGGGVSVRSGESNTINGCMLKGLGDEAVTIDGGSGNIIRSNDIFDVALGCITLRGGDRRTLSPGGHQVINNHLHHFSRWMRTGQYAVVVDGVGHRVAHNLIHDTPFEAVYVRGNDHLIEYNEIHSVTRETGDAGALHTGRDWTWRGTIIRHNYFHDLQGPGLHGVMGVYLDDWASGFTVTGNLFVRAGRATLIGGGRDNRVEGNMYIECAPSVHVDARGRGWASYYFDGSRTELQDKMDAMNFRKPPYSLRYPSLLSLYDDEPTNPKGNVVAGNVSLGGRWLDVYDYHSFPISVVAFRDNVVADSLVLRRMSDGVTGWDPYYLDIDRKEGYSHFTRANPEIRELFPEDVFTDNAGCGVTRGSDVWLAPTGAAARAGFLPPPVQTMGLRLDEYRTILPGPVNDQRP